jgi:hypothetical protein
MVIIISHKSNKGRKYNSQNVTVMSDKVVVIYFKSARATVFAFT